ncbi:sensor histidine kinase [Occallatibacter savannae]|uniref:sensor histidine kinase n=1 Tax=Occallatibacter savannae TaxID=1002691 RepID=UPI000D69C7A7|nr:sensor histidine kinase [Occallatibacter savannae]
MTPLDAKTADPVPATSAGATAACPAPNLFGSIRRADEAMRQRGFTGLRPYTRRWFDFIWLIYTVFFFIEPVQRNSRPYWIQFAAVYAVFLSLYTGIIYAGSRRVAYLCLAGMGVLGLVYYPVNTSSSGMIIYIIAFAPFISDSIKSSIVIFALSSGALMAEGYVLHLNPWTWGFPAFFGLLVGAGNLLAAQRMRSNQKLLLAHEEIEHLAKVAERERIARDLHDVLGHTLSVVVLKSELAGKILHQNPERAQKEIAEVEQIARTALAEVREAIRGYRAEGLAAELDRARATLDAAGVSLDCSSTPPKLLPAQETVLSLILREAITNIVRHAHASRCEVSFEQNAERTILQIEDDGSGGIRSEGSGLRGMRERVESLNGRLQILSENGTSIMIEIPA